MHSISEDVSYVILCLQASHDNLVDPVYTVVCVYHIGNGLVSPGRNRQVNNPPRPQPPSSHGVILGSEAPPPSNQWVGGGGGG